MTEEEWLTRPAPRKLLEHLEECQGASERKLRLFAAACCRRVQKWFIDPCQHRAIETLEGFADGTAALEEWTSAMLAVQNITELDLRLSEDGNLHDDTYAQDARYHAAEVVAQATSIGQPSEGNPTLFHRVHDVVTNTVDLAGYAADRSLPAQADERYVLCQLLRCIFGNPFHPLVFDPRWRSESAVALASAIYAERAFDRLPILADALEEAGCDHADVLTHLGGPGPHTRGCWVVDAMLGME
jgi:hypothetical protein